MRIDRQTGRNIQKYISGCRPIPVQRTGRSEKGLIGIRGREGKCGENWLCEVKRIEGESTEGD